MKDTMKIPQYLKESGLLNKSVSKKNQNEMKEQKGGFLGMLAATLGASLLVKKLKSFKSWLKYLNEE